jgi:hypothetical protein
LSGCLPDGMLTANDAAMLILSERLKNSMAGLLHKCGFVYMLVEFHAGGGFRVPAERISAIPRLVFPDPNLRG